MSITPSQIHARQKILSLLTASLAVLLGGIQLFFYLTGYEFDSGLYQHGPLSHLTALLWILSAALVVALSLTLPKKDLCEEITPPPSAFNDFSALISAIALIGSVVAIFAFRSNPADPLCSLLASLSDADSTARTALLLSMLMAIPSAIHFFLYFTKRINHPLGIASVLAFVAFTALRVYFDMRYLLMSPQRILHLMALLSAMLFLIAELRMARGNCGRKLYFSLSGICAIFAFADAFSNLLLSLMSWQALGAEITVYFFLLSMSLLAFSRILSFTYNESNENKTEIILITPQEKPVINQSEDNEQ